MPRSITLLAVAIVAAAAVLATRLRAGAPPMAPAAAPSTRPAGESIESRAALTLDAADEDLLRTRAAIALARQAIVENIANAESTAYKAVTSRVSDAGRHVAFGRDMSQGPIENTSRVLDLAIEGDGFFRVLADGKVAYTRIGNLFINREGALVVGMADGYHLQPEIVLPADARQISISSTGLIEYMRPGVAARQTAGQLHLVTFPEPSALKQHRCSVFLATAAAGEPIENAPGRDGAGLVLQSFLEGSNVDTVREQLRLARLSEWQRAIDAALRTLAEPSK